MCKMERDKERQRRIKRKYVYNDNEHSEGHACHRNGTN